MLKELSAILKEAMTERSIKIAVAALVVDLLIASATIVVLVGYPLNGRWLNTSQQPFVVGELITGFVGIWFIFALITRQELIDAFTKVRSQICGSWLITYGASVNYQGTEDRFVTCDIKQNLIKKLEFEFRLVGNPIFEDQVGHVVKDIALREIDAGRYAMFYYFETKRRLQPALRAHLLSDRAHPEEVDIETLGIVSFDAPAAVNQNVSEMIGKWYDLNGNMMRILELIRLTKEAEIKDEIFHPIFLQDIPVSNIHFDADMGTVHFAFQGRQGSN